MLRREKLIIYVVHLYKYLNIYNSKYTRILVWIKVYGNFCATVYPWYLLYDHSDDCIAVEFLVSRSRETSRVRWYNVNSCGRRHFIAVACGLLRDYSSRNSPRPHPDKNEFERLLCNHLEFVYLWTGANMSVAIHALSTITN